MKKDWWNKEFRVMMTMGDSITAGGWSSSRERCWASQLTRMINEYQRTPVLLVNLGIGANVLSTRSAAYSYSGKPAANERLDEHVLSYKAWDNPVEPDLLIFAYGINDARGGTPVEVFCEEMEAIVRRVREKIQPLIILTGPYHIYNYSLGDDSWGNANPEILNRYNKATKELADRLGCLFVDLLSAYNQADWLVHYDGCHANDLGHRVVANKIFEVLATNCSGLSLETKYLETQIIPWRDESTLVKQWENERAKNER